MSPSRETLRLDKWLWQARFFKTRGLAAKIVSGGKVRVNSEPVSKPARAVGPGDVLTFSQGDRVRVVEIAELGTRRGPATEAQGLYKDLSPDPPDRSETAQNLVRTGPRPTKKDRRTLDAAKGRATSLE